MPSEVKRKLSLTKFWTVPLILFLVTAAIGEGTRSWEQSKFEELAKGGTRGIALRSTGGLQLAPAFRQLYASPSTYIWAIAADSSGTLYAAAGAPARIYTVSPDGKVSTIFEPQELQVQSLVVDNNGVIYAATSPDGKVYKIEQNKPPAPVKGKKGQPEPPPPPPGPPTWTKSVYFDPNTKYIWDLALDAQGNLYVATGDHGEVFRITPAGDHSLFFKSDEAHIRVLAIDPKGNLIAGSDGSGLVYRISPAGVAFVLYSAPKKEITALAIDDAGNIYAAGIGEKRTGAPPPVTSTAATPQISSPAVLPGPGMNLPLGIGPIPQPQGLAPFPAPGVGTAGGSEVYRISPDGSPLRIWTSQNDLVYALAFDDHGNLLAGSGNRGHVFAITGQDEFVDLIKAGATQVTAFAKAPSGGLYASTSNLGKLFLIGPASETEGTYDSDVFDAKTFSRWGRAEFRGIGDVQLFARSGNVDNPDRNWSPWKQIDLVNNATLPVPAARFVQWRAVLRAGNVVPRLDSMLVNYLPKNVAPEIEDVTVQIGMRYPFLPKQPSGESPQPAPIRDRESMSVKWAAHDDNDDELIYTVFYRGDGETRWLLLKDNVAERYFSFDAGLLPDGGYSIKVLASDSLSHSPGEALSTEKESGRFEVDTTAPTIQNLSASLNAGLIQVSFRSLDNFSPIKRAEYSLDAGEWQFVEPIDQISDSKSEEYNLKIRVSEPGTTQDLADNPKKQANRAPVAQPAGEVEHVLVVRTYDRFDNMGTAKVLVRSR
jgi:sugar lactone lactonase YvrE